jgi:hypothetical protein
MTTSILPASAVLLFVIATGAPASAQEPAAGGACRATGSRVELRGLPEASGVALSRTGRLWTHNDSGAPVIFELDPKAGVKRRVTVTGAAVDDWEAIAAGPCPGGRCLYIGDIGDNGARRRAITIYRLPEPEAAAETVAVNAVFHATYPDGPHDAEALLVTADGRMFVVTKGSAGSIAVYALPDNPRPNATVAMRRVGNPMAPRAASEQRITDGAVGHDGASIVLRTGSSLTFYPSAQFARGEFAVGRRVDVSHAREPQGEGVALGPNGTVYLLGEGGGGGRPGTLIQLTCSAPL